MEWIVFPLLALGLLWYLGLLGSRSGKESGQPSDDESRKPDNEESDEPALAARRLQARLDNQYRDSSKSTKEERETGSPSQSSLPADLRRKMHSKHGIPLERLFLKLCAQSQAIVLENLEHAALEREKDRRKRLQTAQRDRQTQLDKLAKIESEINNNDKWFLEAKNGEDQVDKDELLERQRKAQSLYTRRTLITTKSLPASEASLKKLEIELEREKEQEHLFAAKDLETALGLFQISFSPARRDADYPQVQKKTRSFGSDSYENKDRPIESGVPDRDKLRAKVLERGVPYLVHFTPVANLESILDVGILSRQSLKERSSVFTDDHRFDGLMGWVSLSIGFPNYKMFYAKRNELPTLGGWVVLILSKACLWDLDCKFIYTNAASFGVRSLTEKKWSTVEAFEKMFEAGEYRIGIPDYFTTDPQAEVMVSGHVPRQYIVGIALEKAADMPSLGDVGELPVKERPELFRGRRDHEIWRGWSLSESDFHGDARKGVQDG